MTVVMNDLGGEEDQREESEDISENEEENEIEVKVPLNEMSPKTNIEEL